MIYACAFFAAAIVYILLTERPALLRAFLADCAATLFVWLAGVLLKNSSVYDPYWSVAPPVLAACWAFETRALTLPGALLLLALLAWGARLTLNWARRWRGFAHQDWRYTMYREKMPKLWPFVNLFGIHLMPTVLVFLAMIPVYEAFYCSGANALTFAGFALCALAVGIEYAADARMDAYRRRPQPKSPTIAEGVWLWCRHPNYLGEILFWWGIWLMQISLVPVYWSAIGAALVTALFAFASIPMMEKHLLESKPEYAEYKKKVPMLLPIGGLRKLQ